MNRYLSSLAGLLIVIIACGNTNMKGWRNTTMIASEMDADSVPCKIAFNSDSLYVDLVGKVGADAKYISVMRFLVDSIVPSYNRYQCAAYSNHILDNPLKYLTQTKLDSMTLVTMAEGDKGCFYYFLLDRHDSIVCHQFSDTYHTIVLDRTFRDWNNDGEKEIVERRQYVGQLWSSISEFVLYVEDNKLRIMFCINLSEENCITVDSMGLGSLTTRQYQATKDGLFHVTERASRCNCDKYEAKPKGKVSTMYYTISADYLIKTYGDAWLK